MKKQKKAGTYKDTLLNRMKAVEAFVACDNAFEIDCAFMEDKKGKSRYKTMKREALEVLFEDAARIIVDVYHLSHGYRSSCCKGRGAELIDPAIKSYFGEPK